MDLTRQRIQRILMVLDSLLIALSGLLSVYFLQYYIAFELTYVITSVILMVIFYLMIGNYYRIFSKINRYTSIRDQLDIYITTFFAIVISIGITSLIFNALPMRYALLLYVFSTQLITFSRMSWRRYNEFQRRKGEEGRTPETENRVLVVGAGEGGQLFIDSMNKQRDDIDVFGVIDDDPNKLNTYLNSIPVLGTTDNIEQIAKENRVDEIVVAVPSLPPEKYEKILDTANSINVPVKKMPLIEDVMLGKLQVSSYVDVDITDLLGREEVKLDTSEVRRILQGKTILITGAGGSIGSELVRQVSRFQPARVLLLDHGENPTYQINREMHAYHYAHTEFVPIIADVQDKARIDRIMAEYKPQYIFHAAAHKHVPMMEYNPTEAIKNNIYGTLNVAQAAVKHDVEKFIMISTDKANNPTNVMGATKRVAEMIVTGMNEQGKTSFAAVRFGNVLGSAGSVIPLFKEQIQKGGPVTVTDFRMTRYFMTIPEAARLVVQAGIYADGGEIFILDMGEPVRIYDLAKKIIKLSGYTLDDIEIEEIGIRPGEKLYEELLLDDETTGEKIYDKIFIGKINNTSLEEIREFVTDLDLSGNSDDQLAEQLINFVTEERQHGPEHMIEYETEYETENLKVQEN